MFESDGVVLVSAAMLHDVNSDRVRRGSIN
jgi:hypothetical protein